MKNLLKKYLEDPIAFINLTGVIRQIRIQNRLFISFVILSLIPLLITSIFAYIQSSAAIKTKIGTYSMEVINQISNNLQNELARFENDSVDIAFSDIFQYTLTHYKTMSEWRKYDAQLKMQNILAKRYLFFRSVSDILVFTRDQQKLLAYGDYYFTLKLKPDYLNSILNEAAARNGVPLWLIEDGTNEVKLGNPEFRAEKYGEYGLVLARSFRSMELGVPIGYIVMRINEKYISNKFRDINIGYGSDIFILNSRGVVVSSRNPATRIARPYPNRTFVKELQKNMSRGRRTFYSIASGKPSLVAYTYIPGADWFLVSTIPFSYLNSESTRIGIWIAILGFVCFLLALVMSFIVAKSIAKPLRQLMDSMKNVKEGNFVVQIRDDSKDEIAEVTGNFNNMVRELQSLIEEVKNKEKLKRRAELKTLQAQINPHFLSNTLNTVRWLANIQKAENISSIVTSLTQLLYGCTGKGSEWVKLRDEIEYVRNYLNIMEYRYYDKFKVHFEVEEEILDCRVLKFMLQPIIENSLIHGLEPLDGQGIIVVKGYRTGNELKLIIRDNGVGMTEDILRNLMHEKPEHQKDRLSGIGIWNIEERIKLNFGDEFGIRIESVPNLYTAVSITIPVIETGEGGAGPDAQSTDCG